MKLVYNGVGPKPQVLEVRIDANKPFEIKDEALARKLLMHPNISRVEEPKPEPKPKVKPLDKLRRKESEE